MTHTSRHYGPTAIPVAMMAIIVVTLSLATGCQDDPVPEATPGAEAGRVTNASDSVVLMQVASEPTSVLGLLTEEHDVRYSSSRMGAFVESIDSVAGSGGWFWRYTVNGTAGQVAADKHQLQPGDTVVWHFRKAL